MSSLVPANRQIQETLIQVAKVDGPVRLFKSRATPNGEGLLCVGRGPAVRQVLQLLDTYLQEIPRSPGQPRLIRLSNSGIRALLEFTSPARRSALVREVAPFYRETLLRSWRQVASPAEMADLQQILVELFQDLLPQTLVAAAPEIGAFVRAMGKELVSSWEHTREPEARRGLARAMLSLGVKEIGRAGDRASFAGRIHFSEEPVFPGDPVEIIEPGWTVPDQQGDFLLRKAQVKPVASHA